MHQSQMKKRVLSFFSNKMVAKMSVLWFCFILFVIGIDAKGRLDVLYSPDSLEFSGSGTIRQSTLKEVFFTALGLSSHEYFSTWDGLYLADPFSTPEAVVVVFVPGVPNLGRFDNAKSYPVDVDEVELNAFEVMRDRIRQRATKGNTLVDIKLSDLQAFTDALGNVSMSKVPKRELSHLKYAVDEDFQFLTELDALKAVTTSISTNNVRADNTIDFYNLRFTTLHALTDFHGVNSEASAEAKALLRKQIEELKKVFKNAYDGRVLVTVVCSDVAEKRRIARAADAEATSEATMLGGSDSAEHNITVITQDPPASPNPPIFNICLWLGLLLIFSLMAIVYAFLDMDPGRDSIIYRMTSNRTKKDY